MTYQAEIQGLRAIAVVAVIANHLDRSVLPGGFLGVDLFFVISGTLITGLLVAEHERSGRISLLSFYGRRARRIVPALLVTCVAVVGVGFLLLSDERFEDLCESAFAALFTYSNIHFWSEVGYFDAEAASKPLLHTWSLGVEEQFYFFWPLMLAAVLRLRPQPWVAVCVVGISLASLLLNVAFIHGSLSEVFATEEGFRAPFEDATASAFYWMPFRVFEFGLGALLSLNVVPTAWRSQRRLADVTCAGALAVIALALALSSEDDSAPYLHALALAMATALAIHSAPSSPLGRAVLGNRFVIFVGGLSYALYLVHWPLIVYWDLLGGTPGPTRVVVLGSAMLVSAYGLHVLVERPVRAAAFLLNAGPGWRGVGRQLLIPALTVVSGVLCLQAAEVERRIPNDRRTGSVKGWRRVQRKHYCNKPIPGLPADLFTCQRRGRSAKRTLVVWGDSHAHQLAAGLIDAFPRWNLAIAYQSNCIPQTGFGHLTEKAAERLRADKCSARNQAFVRWAEEQETPVTVLLTNRWHPPAAEIGAINNRLIRRLEAAGHRAFVLEDFVSPNTQLAQCRAVPDYILSNAMLQQICKPDAASVHAQLLYGRELASVSDNYIPVHATQCPNDVCGFLDDEGKVTHRDYQHLSFSGARFEVRRAAATIGAAIEPKR